MIDEKAKKHWLANYEKEIIPKWCLVEKLKFHARISSATPSLNTLRAMHFHSYKKLRHSFYVQLKEQLGDFEPPAIEKASLIIVRCCSGAGLDWSNALGGIKPLEDCLSKPSKRNPDGLHIIEDDNLKGMPFCPFMIQCSAPRGASYTDLYVFEAVI